MTWNLSFAGVARKLASSGYGVFAMDYPGFGLSEGLHGFIPSFDELVDDVIEQYSKIRGTLHTPINGSKFTTTDCTSVTNPSCSIRIGLLIFLACM